MPTEKSRRYPAPAVEREAVGAQGMSTIRAASTPRGSAERSTRRTGLTNRSAINSPGRGPTLRSLASPSGRSPNGGSSTKANRSAKTVAGYRSLLDTVVLATEDVPLRDVRFDDLQVWTTSLSVDGSVRFAGKGLSASRVRQAHQLVGAVLKFAVKAKHLPASPADGVELPRLPETEQCYLTHEQLHRVAVAAGRLRTSVLVLGYCGLRFGEAAALQVADVDVSARRIRVRRSVTYVRKTGLVEGPTKNHNARTVPVPVFVARLLATEIDGRDGGALVFPSARGGGYLTLGPGPLLVHRRRSDAVGGDATGCGCTIFGTRAHRWRSAPGPM